MKRFFTVILTGILGISACFGLSACSLRVNTLADKDKYTAGNAEITDKVEAIDIEWASGDVVFVQGSGNTVIIEETYQGSLPEDKQMHWCMDGTTLRVRFDISLSILSLGSLTGKKLTVTLPADLVLNNADIDVASADVEAGALRCRNFDFDAASGNVNVTFPDSIDSAEFDTASGDVTVAFGSDVGKLDTDAASGKLTANIAGSLGSFDCDSASGEVIINASGKVGSGKVSTSSGKVSISCEGLDGLDVSTASGSVTLRLPENVDMTLDIDTASGDFESDIPFSIKGDGKYVIGSGTANVNIDTASGDIIINKI